MNSCIDDFLQNYGLSLDLLNTLSFESKIDTSLKNSLLHFDKNALISEIQTMIDWLDEQDAFLDVSMDYRIKSIDSVLIKYDKYINEHIETRKIFNDILGFRGFCDNYDDVLKIGAEQFRVVDMSNGKAKDDGYRGVHVYFQKTNKHYPIEIQFNTLFDRQINNWLHDYVYKKNYPNIVGILLRKNYESGKILNKLQFEEELENVLLNSER